MSEVSRRDHWEQVYSTKGETEVSWFQDTPALSLDLIDCLGATPDTTIVDIGGGASRLVDSLIARGFKNVTVLDLSEAALAVAKSRLADRSKSVQWIAADVTKWYPSQTYDLWHDRATFHFLTEPIERVAYLDRLVKSLNVGGYAIIGTFALDGPEQCSGLPIIRYDSATLAQTLGSKFQLMKTQLQAHATPWGAVQRFQFSTFQRVEIE